MPVPHAAHPFCLLQANSLSMAWGSEVMGLPRLLPSPQRLEWVSKQLLTFCDVSSRPGRLRPYGILAHRGMLKLGGQARSCRPAGHAHAV